MKMRPELGDKSQSETLALNAFRGNYHGDSKEEKE